MRRVAVVTFGRAELGSCLPIARGIEQDPALELALIVSGSHLQERFGSTVDDVERAGLPVAVRIDMPLESDSPAALVAATGRVSADVAAAYEQLGPDLLLIVGDRFELLAAAGAAVPFRLPIAHVSGGDVTEAAFDNAIRYAVTALSHIHFVAMPEHAERLERSGEEAWRIHVTGEPALDLAVDFDPLSPPQLEEALGLRIRRPLVAVTFHPTTLGTSTAVAELDALLAALDSIDGTLVVTYPNLDPEHGAIIERLRRFAEVRDSAGLYPSLGQGVFYSLLAHADLMLGNSSSGIWEAPTFRLPVVNLGERQRGRIRVANVVDAPFEVDAISDAVRRALDPAFRASLDGLENPYGDGRSTERILAVLRGVDLGPRLLRKRFAEVPSAAV